MPPLNAALHERFVLSRRFRVLASRIVRLLPHGARVLDVGAGSGAIAALIARERSDVTVTGVDVGARESTAIPVTLFDGETLPFADASFDVALLIDVLHHTQRPESLLREAARVAPAIVLKHHTKEGPLAGPRLAFMDYVGNGYCDVPLPNNYYTRAQWRAAFAATALRESQRCESLGLYPFPANLVFERGLHFMSLLSADADPRSAPAIRRR